MKLPRTRLTLLWLLSPVLFAPPVLAGEEPTPGARILEKVAPAVVSVKGVLTVRWSSGGESEERESQIFSRAVLVDPTGIVMMRNTTLGGDHAELAEWKEENPDGNYQAVPASLRVLFGNDPTEHKAAILAQDPRLDLAFLKILEPGKEPLRHVDLSLGSKVRIADELYGVTRSTSGFDYAPGVMSLYVSGRVEKPRAMWSVSGDFTTLGLPAFDAEGRPVGVLANQAGARGAESDGDTAEGTFLLPLEPVLKSLEAARKKVPEVLERAAKEQEKEGEKDGEKKEGEEKESEKKDGAPPEAPRPPEPPVAPEGK